MPHDVVPLLAAGSVITLLHALGPDHWLPHVLVSKAQGWGMGRALRVTLLAALGHVGLTLILGFVILFVLLEVAFLSAAVTTTVAALVLLGAGVLFLVRGLLRRDHAHAEAMSDGAATLMLLLVAAFPPCYAILPLFLAAGAWGWGLGLSLALLFSGLTVGTMLLLVALGRRGYASLARRGILHTLEERQDLFLGGVFLLLALLVWLGL